jgi:hypothetical protein
VLQVQASAGWRSSIQTAGRCPANRAIRGTLSQGWNGGGHGDHRDCCDPQERGQQAVGVIVPGRGPGDVEDMPKLGPRVKGGAPRRLNDLRPGGPSLLGPVLADGERMNPDLSQTLTGSLLHFPVHP